MIFGEVYFKSDIKSSAHDYLFWQLSTPETSYTNVPATVDMDMEYIHQRALADYKSLISIKEIAHSNGYI